MRALEQPPVTWRGWLARIALVLALLLAAEQILEDIAVVALVRPADAAEALGIDAGLAPGPPRVLTGMTSKGAADRAGLRPGDVVQIDLLGNFNYQPGSEIPVVVDRQGHKFATVLTARAPEGRSAQEAGLILSFAVIRVVLFGLILLLFVRGRGNRAANLLAVGLFVLFTDRQSTWLPHWTIVPIELLWAPVTAIGVYCLTRFPLEISSDEIDPKQARFVLWVGSIAAIAEGTFKLMNSAIVPVPNAAIPAVLLLGGTLLSNLTGIALMIVNYPKADARTRNRIKVVASAFICMGLGWLVLRSILVGMGVEQLTAALVSAPFSFLGLGLLTYSVLGQRLFDFGFAINRTLVYGAVSFTLLAAFGLADWGADRLVPEEWHKQSALFSAGIALLLFLSFHRVRDWFEHHIERLFFHRWQENEAELKRFVANAAHFEQAPALCREFASEIERFAQGAAAALYLRGEDGGYDLQCGAQPRAAERYAEDNRLFAAMRAERQPVEIAGVHSAIPGALALPMLDQLGLAGFVLLGPRPDGAHYRPDEIDNLAWATHQVGLDLQALQARELRAEVAALRDRLAGRAMRRRRTKSPSLTALPGGASAR